MSRLLQLIKLNNLQRHNYNIDGTVYLFFNDVFAYMDNMYLAAKCGLSRCLNVFLDYLLMRIDKLFDFNEQKCRK